MPRTRASTGPKEELALLDLFRAISLRQRQEVRRRITAAPSLAGMALKVGATRAEAKPYFLSEIARVTYAGDTPLHIAAAAYERELAVAFVARGANARARNRRGAEPLHYAADGIPGSLSWNPDGQRAMIEFLIEVGANPDAKDKSGVTPLHRAVRTRCAAAVRALLANGADALCGNGSESTPLHLAVQDTGRGGAGSGAARAEQAEIIRLLLGHGARPSDKDGAGKRVRDCVRSDWIRELLRTA